MTTRPGGCQSPPGHNWECAMCVADAPRSAGLSVFSLPTGQSPFGQSPFGQSPFGQFPPTDQPARPTSYHRPPVVRIRRRPGRVGAGCGRESAPRFDPSPPEAAAMSSPSSTARAATPIVALPINTDPVAGLAEAARLLLHDRDRGHRIDATTLRAAVDRASAVPTREARGTGRPPRMPARRTPSVGQEPGWITPLGATTPRNRCACLRACSAVRSIPCRPIVTRRSRPSLLYCRM